jgi:hypothetical protein
MHTLDSSLLLFTLVANLRSIIIPHPLIAQFFIDSYSGLEDPSATFTTFFSFILFESEYQKKKFLSLQSAAQRSVRDEI